MFRSISIALLFAASSAQLSIEVPGGFGTIQVREGEEPAVAVERFSQLTRTATGHVFEVNELQNFVNAFCNEIECKQPSIGTDLALELGGIGTIVVKPGQAPIEAIDSFLVKAKAQGHSGLSPENVNQVVGYFCNMKACVTTTPAPLELPVQGMGTVSIAFGEEVADGIERFAKQARQAGLPLNLDGVQQIAARLCSYKTCNRPVNLPPVSLSIQGVGDIVVPFGVEPCDAIETFSANRYNNGYDYISQNDVNVLMERLCSLTVCTKQCQPVKLDIEDGSSGGILVRIGEEPADAARDYLSQVISKGVISNKDIDSQNIPEQIMSTLCKMKACRKGLDLNPSKLNVENIGSIVIPLGGNPTTYVEDFLERARSAGHRISADGASMLMENVCRLKGTAGCTQPLDVSSISLNISGVPELLTVPFGDEPADAAASWMVQARAYGVKITEPNALAIMENLCSLKRCNKPLDVSPLQINVDKVGVLTVPFGEEPAMAITKFLLQARSKGHVLGAEAANNIMRTVCDQRPCLVPLDVSDYSLDIQGVGRFVVTYGEEPAMALQKFVDEVIRQGGNGLIDTAAANQIMTETCSQVTCFVPLDVRPVSIEVQDLGTVVVPFGFDPTTMVREFLMRVSRAGYTVDNNMAEQIMNAVCSAGRSKAGLVYCHRPLDVRPYTLSVQGLGDLKVPFGTEPADAVSEFLSQAMNAGHAIDESHVKLLMENVCQSVPCNMAVNTAPITLNITDMGMITVKYGEEPSVVVRNFISHSVYEGKIITPEQAGMIMENLCSRTQCRKPLDLSPASIEVQGAGVLQVPYDVVPQAAVRNFGNQHRLSVYVMQQVMDQLCTRVPCEKEK